MVYMFFDVCVITSGNTTLGNADAQILIVKKHNQVPPIGRSTGIHSSMGGGGGGGGSAGEASSLTAQLPLPKG